MEKSEHVEPAAAAPGVSGADVLRYIPVLLKLLEIFAAGEGSFTTWTPLGRKKVTVTNA